MPSGPPISQPEAKAPDPPGRERGSRLVSDVQRMAIPELTRVFGQHGLYLRPLQSHPRELSGNMLANVVCLHRQDQGLDGAVRCVDHALPICSSSLSLVYSLFMLESSPDPGLLMQEISRVLQPEGIAMVVSLNPWSLAQLQWQGGGRVSSSATIERLAHAADLEVVRRRFLGPHWSGKRAMDGRAEGPAWLDGFRVARLLILRRREGGMIPLRKAPAAVSLRPGMSAG